MRRAICLLTVVLLCVAMACPVFAADTFVPSISEKDHPDVEWPVLLVGNDGETVDEVKEGCLVITPVSEAETSGQIPEEAKKELLDVYKQLTDGTMTLPGGDELVIRDLFDASLICTDGHKETLAQEGVYIKLTFDLGIKADEPVVVMAYINGEWVSAHKVVNNGDGTVTAELEDICPIAIAVDEDYYDTPAQTGDPMGTNLMLWVLLMVASAAALVVVLFARRKEVR